MKSSTYTSRQPDKSGQIPYSAEENSVWRDLMKRQIPMLNGRACTPWIDAFHEMNFPMDRVPQLEEISNVLQKHTGWSVSAVPALIGFTEFFQLLANKQFPVATFIRRREDFDYLQEPDIFHELFGHTPPLTDHRFAAFVEAYGKAGLAADPSDHAMLARLFWFTVEFGLVNTEEGIRASCTGERRPPLQTLRPHRRVTDALPHRHHATRLFRHRQLRRPVRTGAGRPAGVYKRGESPRHAQACLRPVGGA
jgi:phenylalanine-4-hydroxylase